MITLLLPALLIQPIAFQSGPNLAPNGNFSLGGEVPQGWTNLNQDKGKFVVRRDASVFVSSPASLCLATVGGPGTGNVAGMLNDVAGKQLEISGQTRTSGPSVTDAQVAVFVQDANYKMLMWQPIASRWHFKDGEWSSFSGRVTIPSAAKNVMVMLYLQGEGKAWLDDLSVRDLGDVAPTGTKSNLVDVLPVTDQILAVHFKDGYVEHHKVGQKRGEERVVGDPLDIAIAMRPATYSLVGTSDPSYATPTRPVEVSRKSKGADFAWLIEKWAGDNVENTSPDHVKEHWLYLSLPKPIRSGQEYTLTTGSLAKSGGTVKFKFDERKARSESVHVNLVGYAPEAKAKYGYVYQWLGSKGGLDLKDWAGRKFWLVDSATGKDAFQGVVALRKPMSAVETMHLQDSPNGNFQQADVYQCDFSSFTKPGQYVLAVEGIGCSFPFKVDSDIYREAFRTTVRGLFHNRSGIELKRANTAWVRPAPHNPRITPGFAGKLKYTTSRLIDWSNYEGAGGDKAAMEAGIKGPLDVYGWYQDAGDWDGYWTHMRVAQELLLTYQLAPSHFAAKELNIPESGNGLPDILNEAAWLPRFGYRVRHALRAKKWGTGGVGLRASGDQFGSDTGPKDIGQGSWQDVDRTWIISGEDPLSTYIYAGASAQLASCLKQAGKPDPDGVDWAKEARESFAWAKANMRMGDEAKEGMKVTRAYAEAALFALTGESRYEALLAEDLADVKEDSLLWDSTIFGPSVYVLSGRATDTALAKRLRAAILRTASAELESSEKRALRWGGDWGFPMLIGHQTTPWVRGMMVGSVVAAKSDPALALRYRSALYTTADFFLGTNGLNQTWVTGLGPRHPNFVFHMDSWYNGQKEPVPGIIPYGPWRKERDQGPGPWDKDWANKSAFPAIDLWPGTERWFNNRCSPMSSEFTIWQNTAPAAALFGFLCGKPK